MTKPRSTRFARTLAHARDCSTRPIAAVVGMDPAYKGDAGLCVWRVGADAPHEWYSGPAIDARTFMWLGNRVAEVCEPGTRVVLAVESNAYGSGIARQLGRAAGAIEGLLVDLNAIESGSVIDVAASEWRRAAGLEGVTGRAALKRAAVNKAAEYAGSATGMDHNAAEATLLTRCVVRVIG